MQSKAEKIQDEIYKKMPAERKIKLTGQFFELAKKLNKLNDLKLKSNDRRRTFNKNSRNLK